MYNEYSDNLDDFSSAEGLGNSSIEEQALQEEYAFISRKTQELPHIAEINSSRSNSIYSSIGIMRPGINKLNQKFPSPLKTSEQNKSSMSRNTPCLILNQMKETSGPCRSMINNIGFSHHSYNVSK